MQIDYFIQVYLISKWYVQKKYVSLQFCNYAARKRIDLFFCLYYALMLSLAALFCSSNFLIKSSAGIPRFSTAAFADEASS